MSTALLIGSVLVAALACPAMMWWQSRRGGSSSCARRGPEQATSGKLEELRRRHDRLEARVAELDRRPRGHRPGVGQEERPPRQRTMTTASDPKMGSCTSGARPMPPIVGIDGA